MKANDPWTLVIAAAVLALVAALAGFLPARSASRLDALNALCED
jgi:ABC-type antimicrobial peptide transport system permease subunit